MNMVSTQHVAARGQHLHTASLLVAQRGGDSNEDLHAERLRVEYGSCFVKRNGRRVLNDGFWGAWLCLKLGIFFDQDSDIFRTTLMPMTQSNRLSADGLVKPVTMLLIEASKAL